MPYHRVVHGQSFGKTNTLDRTGLLSMDLVALDKCDPLSSPGEGGCSVQGYKHFRSFLSQAVWVRPSLPVVWGTK